MVDVNMLRTGDRVKIVDCWVPGCRQNEMGKMDCWLGSIMTVRSVNNVRGDKFVRMMEDRHQNKNGWYWYPEAIDCLEEDTAVMSEPSNVELEAFLLRCGQNAEKDSCPIGIR